LLEANRLAIYYKYLIISFYNLKKLVDDKHVKKQVFNNVIEVYRYSDCFN